MGTDINGWVEGRPDWADEDDPWVAIINVGMILGRSYETFRRLFGVRLYENDPIVPLAANRGLPADMSLTVQKETALAPGEESERYLDGWICCHSASWLGWSEIQSLKWSEFGEDYQLLFQLMQVLSDGKRYADLRLVVWFDN
jgi:hypothetical protein